MTDAIFAFQPLFAAPIYFSVLVNTPPLWLSLIIATIPFGFRFWLTKRLIHRTPFDLPIVLFILGMLVGLIVTPNKEVALGALCSTLASILIYYGIVGNSEAESKYWLWMAGVICVISILMSIWFFSQGNGRQFIFNQWAFELFEGLIRILGNGGPLLSWNTIGALLVVVIPPLFGITLFNNTKSLRITGLVLGLIFLGILFLTISGGGWIAVTCGLAFILVRWRLWMIGVILPVVGSIASAVVIFYDKALWLKQAFLTGSLLGRLELWSNTIRLINGYSIVTGLGFGNWIDIYNSNYNTAQQHSHNSYLQLYTDTGILGGLAIITGGIVFVRLSISILSSSKHDSWYGVAVGLIGSIIGGAVFACYDATIYGDVVTATSYIYLSIPLLWILVALLVVSSKRLSLSN